DEARKDVAQQAPLKPDFIKIWVDDFWGQYPKMPPEIYKTIIVEAHKEGLRVAAHLYHLDDARSLVAAGVDIIAHSIRDGDIDGALLADMRKHHVRAVWKNGVKVSDGPAGTGRPAAQPRPRRRQS